MKNTWLLFLEFLKEVPAPVWVFIGGLFGWVSKRKKNKVDLDGQILESRAKEKKFDIERYDALLDDLIELEKRLDQREEEMRQRDELIKKQNEELLSARELIRELRAELNLLRTIKDTKL